jgi:ppGpp synthetase/RelA/SpoT-type nucleotidyltranferase
MMKISKSLRDIHSSQREQYEQLQRQVDRIMNGLKDRRWHYESRVKDLESFALKIEAGRQYDPNQVEDFFACTLVVENLDSMSKAETLVSKKFKFHKRRPKRNNFTSKPSDSFRFDDTRLYVRWKDDPAIRPTGLNGLLFEVQFKTFLAHAWSVATHDLTYKTDEKSWPKERIAFQIKAMLEHAEISIQEAKKLSKSTSLKKTDELSKRISTIIKLINELWPAEALPYDKKRLAENIDNLIRNVGIELQTLQEILLKETELGKGTKTLNLSPYATIVQSLFDQELEKMKNYLTRRDRRFKVYLPIELELPPSISLARLKNAILSK